MKFHEIDSVGSIKVERCATYADMLISKTPSEGRLEFCQDTKLLYVGDGSNWKVSGKQLFTELEDAPASYTGKDGYIVAVDETNSVIVFETIATVLGRASLSDIGDFPPYDGHVGQYLKATSSGPTWGTPTSGISVTSGTSGVNGAIGPSGTSGTSGTSADSGLWPTGEPRSVVFDTPGSTTWTVPSGVTSILVEVRGGDGGYRILTIEGLADYVKPGSMGGYCITDIPVLEGEIVSISVGASGGNYNDGGASQVVYNGITYGRSTGGDVDGLTQSTSITDHVGIGIYHNFVYHGVFYTYRVPSELESYHNPMTDSIFYYFNIHSAVDIFGVYGFYDPNTNSLATKLRFNGTFYTYVIPGSIVIYY